MKGDLINLYNKYIIILQNFFTIKNKIYFRLINFNKNLKILTKNKRKKIPKFIFQIYKIGCKKIFN